MAIKLLVCLKVSRKKFIQEDYTDHDHIFALVRSGSFSFTSPSGQHTVGPLEGALFRANEHYHREVLSPVTMYLFRFQSDGQHFHGEHIIFRDTERIRSTLDLLDAMEGRMQKTDLTLHSHLFADLIVQQTIEGIRSIPSKEQDSRIQKVLKYIRMNLDKKLVLTDLATYAGLSYAQFFRLFKENTGSIPTDHILMLRMQKAKHLLADTDLPIREIAAACGFDNEFYFSNVFKRHTALSPSVFRRQLR